MRKHMIIILILCLTTSLGACNKETQQNTTVSFRIFHADITGYGLEQAIEMADLVVKVKILDVNKIVNETPFYYTYFNSKVLDVFKNKEEISNNIIVQQIGNNQNIFEGNRIFEKGDTYIFVLRKLPRLENSYGIISEHFNIFEVIELNKKKHVIKWGTTPADNLEDIENLNLKENARMKLKNDLGIEINVDIKNPTVVELSLFEKRLDEISQNRREN